MCFCNLIESLYKGQLNMTFTKIRKAETLSFFRENILTSIQCAHGFNRNNSSGCTSLVRSKVEVIESSFQYYYCGENLQVGTWSHVRGCSCSIEYAIEESVNLELRRITIISTICDSKWEYGYSILKKLQFY